MDIDHVSKKVLKLTDCSTDCRSNMYIPVSHTNGRSIKIGVVMRRLVGMALYCCCQDCPSSVCLRPPEVCPRHPLLLLSGLSFLCLPTAPRSLSKTPFTAPVRTVLPLSPHGPQMTVPDTIYCSCQDCPSSVSPRPTDDCP